MSEGYIQEMELNECVQEMTFALGIDRLFAGAALQVTCSFTFGM